MARALYALVIPTPYGVRKARRAQGRKTRKRVKCGGSQAYADKNKEAREFPARSSYRKMPRRR